MHLFIRKVKLLTNLSEISFKLEKDIQTIFESNLEVLTGWKFIKSEFTIKANRIDTLAYDKENNSFIIIEYKKDRHFSVVDQGVSYLNLMLAYKSRSMSLESLDYLKNNIVITKFEHEFYSDILKKRNLSSKQLDLKKKK